MQNNPEKNCNNCPRLAKFRADNQKLYPHFFNSPVPSFGNIDAKILIVGLAPGLKGANATGRPFTGDYAGELLYPTLLEFGLAKGVYKADPKDGLELNNVRITNAVRCVPPENKPTTAEQNICRNFLANEINSMPNLKIILTLGQIAHNNVIKTLNFPLSKFPFEHEKVHQIGRFWLINTYHTSRYNVNTGRLTLAMFKKVFEKLIKCL